MRRPSAVAMVVVLIIAAYALAYFAAGWTVVGIACSAAALYVIWDDLR